MYSSSGLLNQVLLDALADWAVQAGRNQINQIFAKYQHFLGTKITSLSMKTKTLNFLLTQ